ncbi:xanthine dehydrogenase family protein subunit M [Sphingobium sp. PNB]|uniref:FAD binding domain-containing protein n=1 Tax=Sphingobium sp. PNB TaxID=863934 RepID=UPI001CA3BFCC|nr:xanthine dehydrogenase family protein subunit M [Sphingobium sp. PNB]MCB4862619.1 xanthine dehydrogenase family protein subunit M [Sphingobium sp. PNB]
MIEGYDAVKYYRPTNLDDALKLLAGDPDARCISGGASLVAMMNADLVQPSALVSLKAIAELQGIRSFPDGLIVGAMTKHQIVANDSRFTGGLEVIRSAAANIGHPAIRAVGTIGGSISLADPSADYPAALVAAEARIEIASHRGRRFVPAHEFFITYYTTALEPDEMVVAVHLAAPPGASVSAYRKVGRTEGDFATASVAFCGAFSGGQCTFARVAVGGCGDTPVRSAEANALLVGASPNSASVARAAEALVGACDPVDDVRGSADYRRLLVRRLLPRVFAQASQKAAN